MTPDVNPAKEVAFFILFVSNIPVSPVLGTGDLCQPTEECAGVSREQETLPAWQL